MDTLSPPPDSATVRAYRALERMIVTLELAPGSIATEGALIERVGLGRTPVREAIQRFAWEGLVEIRPRAGLAIAPLRGEDWVRVLDARSGIEQVLARSAARNVEADVSRRLETAADAMRAAAGLAAAAERHVGLIRAILSGDSRAAGEEAKRLMGLLYRYAEAVAQP